MSTVANKRDTRKRIARRRCARGLALAVLLAVLLLCLVDCDPTAGLRSAGAETMGAGLVGSSAAFIIQGSGVEPISPGVRAPLDLKLTNPHDVSMSVTELRVTVQKVSAPNADDAHPCAVGDFTVDQASGNVELTLAARSTSTLGGLGLSPSNLPHVGLLDLPANQDGCKGASLMLAYTASGTLAQ